MVVTELVVIELDVVEVVEDVTIVAEVLLEV